MKLLVHWKGYVLIQYRLHVWSQIIALNMTYSQWIFLSFWILPRLLTSEESCSFLWVKTWSRAGVVDSSRHKWFPLIHGTWKLLTSPQNSTDLWVCHGLRAKTFTWLNQMIVWNKHLLFWKRLRMLLLQYYLHIKNNHLSRATNHQTR